MLIKYFYMCILFICLLIIIHTTLNICDNKKKCLEFSQIIGDPRNNTIVRSIISSHIHSNAEHLITNCISFLLVSFFLLDIIPIPYLPILIWYCTVLIEHCILEVVSKLPKQYVVGASSGVIGVASFYLFYTYHNNITPILLSNRQHLIFKLILLYYSGVIIIKFIYELRNNDEDKISDISHQLGYIGGIVTYYISSFLIKYR